MNQINLKLPNNLLIEAKKYAEDKGYINIQDLIREALRAKVLEKQSFDLTHTNQESRPE
tara:strand:- start:58 stop:234 length:177 start_codon:yes stop_codon:yes gene_type:complete